MELSLAVMHASDGAGGGGGLGKRLNEEALVVSVGAKSSTTVRVPVKFREAGSHVLSAEIKAPGLEADNRCQTAIDVKDPIETLIISGDGSSEECRGETFFFEVARGQCWSRGGVGERYVGAFGERDG